MKRLLALLTMFSMLIIPVSQAMSTYDSDWYWSSYYIEIDWMTTNGIFDIDSEGNVRPDDCTNRAEFLKVLYSMRGGMQDVEVDFVDVEEGVWFESYVANAVADGIAEGFEDETFRPEQCVTRAEGVKMAISAYADELPDPDPAYDFTFDYFTDVNESDWFFETLSWALNIEVVGEEHVVWTDDYMSGEFIPNGDMTRKEVAALLYRIQAVVDNEAEFYDFWAVPFPVGELFTKSCTIDKSDVVKNVPLEWGMSMDADLAVKLDGENRGELRQFAKHIDEIGGGEVWSSLIAEYNWSVAEDISYENLGEEVLMDDWQLGVSWMSSDDPDGEIAIAISVDQFNEFQKIIATQLWEEYGANIECEAHDLYTMWSVDWDDFYVLRYGDLFVLTNTEEGRQGILDQVMNEEGHEEITADALFYAWIDIESSLESFGDIFGLSAMYEELEELEFTINAETDGFRFTTETSFVSVDSTILDAYKDQDLQLVDQVPAGDLLMYMEDQDLSLMVNELFEMISPGEDVYELLATEFALESETLRHLADSGYAFSMSDSGGLVPDTAFYLHLTHNDEKELIPALNAELDELVELMSTEVYYTEDEEYELSYMVQDESVDGDMRKWDVDMTALQTDTQNMFGDDELELYYGLIEEDVYVIALYNDFIDAWGDQSVEDFRKFELSAENIDHNKVAQVQFLNFEQMVPWMETIAESNEGGYSETIYNEAAAWLNRLGLMYGATWVTDKDILHQELFWRL
jgi:hypothetical protein